MLVLTCCCKMMLSLQGVSVLLCVIICIYAYAMHCTVGVAKLEAILTNCYQFTVNVLFTNKHRLNSWQKLSQLIER